MTTIEKILFSLNVSIYLLLVIFSYAYVDLNLTLVNNPQVLKFVDIMQNLGYYNRTQATVLYLMMIVAAFSIYSITLALYLKNKISVSFLKKSVIANTIILVLAYPFLSSDIFNYMFDAKIISFYHLSPYTHRPLDFPNDDWLRFMRWIHRYSPYGPLWLGYSLIPAILGFGKFIFNLFLLKIFISVFHLVNAYLIYKILIKINNKLAPFGTAVYALNPTLLLEGVANAHNDVVLASFLILPIYFYIYNKNHFSFLAIIIGSLVKYIPILNLPWLIWAIVTKQKNINYLIILNLITMAIFTIIFSSIRISVPFVSSGATQVQFQPWYLFWTIPFVALVPNRKLVFLAIAISIGSSLRYLPFLYLGEWSQLGTIEFMQLVTVLPIVLAFVVVASNIIYNYVQKK